MDLLQEVFLGVYRNLHRFRGDAKFSSWIFRIAHNKAIDLSRRKRLLTGYPQGDYEDADPFAGMPADLSQEPDAQLMQSQQNHRTLALLTQLPMEQRLIVELKIYQSMTFEEIADMQDISENTAKTRFYTALKKLKLATEDDHVLS